MQSPNIWIGIGAYGHAVLLDMARRYERVVELVPGEASGRPTLLSVRSPLQQGACDDHSLVSRLDVPLDDCHGLVVDAISRQLPPALRRGNMRGLAYIVVILHGDDLMALPQLSDSKHWLWSLGRTLDFEPCKLSLVVAAEPRLGVVGEAERDREQNLNAALRLIRSAMDDGVVRQSGWPAQLLVLKPAGFYDDTPGGCVPSRDAVVLLFELLASSVHPVHDDPLASLLTGPSLLMDGRDTGCASFSIASRGVNLDREGRHWAIEVQRELLRSLDHRADDLAVPSELPPFEVAPPRIPPATNELAFRFRHRWLDDESSALARLNYASTQLDVEFDAWWLEETRSDLIDSEPSRRQAGQHVSRALAWLDELLREGWTERKATATQLADQMSTIRERLASRGMLESAPAVRRLTRPKFDGLVDELREAIEDCPAAPSIVAMLGAYAVAAAIAVYGTVGWVGERNSPASGVADSIVISVALGTVIVMTEPALRWLIGPRRRVMLATERVQRVLRKAMADVRALRTSLAGQIRRVLQGEVCYRLEREVSLVEQRCRRIAERVLAGSREPTPQIRPLPPNVFEDLTQPLDKSALPSASEVTDAFRRRFLPLLIDNEAGPPSLSEEELELAPERLSQLATAFVWEQVMGRLTSQVRVHAEIAPHELDKTLSGARTTMRSTYVQVVLGEAQAPPGADQTYRTLGRGDRTYYLGVATEQEIAQ